MSEELRRRPLMTFITIEYTHVSADELAKLHEAVSTLGLGVDGYYEPGRGRTTRAAKAEILSANLTAQNGYTVKIKVPVSLCERQQGFQESYGRMLLSGASTGRRIHGGLNIFPNKR